MGFVTAMRGYSLMEVLVAIVVIGVGVLGAAGLQLASSKNTRTALQGTTAVILAQDMAERLRANPQGAYAGVSDGGAPPGFVDCLAARCSAAQLASFDITVWKCSLGRWHDDAVCREVRGRGVLPPGEWQPGLPMGDGEITWRGENEFTVVVTWRSAGEHRVALSGRR